jgi:L-asparagine transporter-like permease
MEAAKAQNWAVEPQTLLLLLIIIIIIGLGSRNIVTCDYRWAHYELSTSPRVTSALNLNLQMAYGFVAVVTLSFTSCTSSQRCSAQNAHISPETEFYDSVMPQLLIACSQYCRDNRGP